MAARFAWILNLDADLELAVGSGYTPKWTVRDAMAPFVLMLAASLLGPEDVLVDADTPARSLGVGFIGRAFCPTPRAIAILERAGAAPEPHPDLDVLRRVNSRAFASGLGQTLPGAELMTDLEAACAKLRSPPPTDIAIRKSWRAKRAFGMTGRGQRVIVAGAASASDVAFVRAGIEEGPLQIEPNVAIEREYAIHGMLAADGGLRLGSVVHQRCDARGAWIATERLTDPSSAELDVGRRLTREARQVAAALFAAGYFGPFGVDAFTYKTPAESSVLLLQPRSEINARYSMGFAIGLGPC